MATTPFDPDRQLLDEDLQIVRGTLAAITPDVRSYSKRSAEAIQEALQRLDIAQREIRAGTAIKAIPRTLGGL
ncbi:MAG: hypothetical protein ACREFX_11260 [Opitutaceae bacterium]